MNHTTCPNCQIDNPDTHNFCSKCGYRLVENCPRCQFSLAEDVNFCGNCGLGLTPASQFLWEQDDLPGAHRRYIQSRGAPPVKVHQGPTESQPDVSSPAPESAQPHLDQYIPRELRSKLEVASAHGGMAGERKIVTMLFCDVKGSTEAAGNLDPEDWTEIINGAFEYMIKPVYKYEGTVARLMGDGILAFFGAPIAHEDDPQRAVLTGLDIISGIEPYKEKILEKWGFDIDVRVGINTGLVVVGAVGSDLRMEYTAMGDAINLAARMEQTAVPGTVQIAQDTHRQVAPLFDFENLGEIEVKGKAEPVPAFRVLGKKKTASRLRGIAGLEAGLVGRADELTRLQTVVANLERGVGRIVCLLGSAGLGKSRLIQEIKETVENNPSINWFETSSLSYESNFPYGVFQQLIRRINGLSAVEDPEQFWEKINNINAQLSEKDQKRIQRVLATLFGVPDPSGQAPLEGENFKRELYSVMRMIWDERFSSKPTMLVLDDLHWADPASIDLLLYLMSTIESNPIVMLCAFRPERMAPSYQIRQQADDVYPHRYTEINLRPLSSEQGDELVNRLLSIADLSDSLRAVIQERAAGNPFYVEEVVRTLIENGAVVPEDRSENGEIRRYWHATTDGVDIDIPDNLQGLLISRIDRLEEGTRQVIQLASVIGRSFYHRVLAEIGRLDELKVDAVNEQIGQLVRLEMIQEAARVPDVEYKFRNPMTQEVAYQSILLKRRREFHGRVAEALEALFPDQLAELAPRLAFHYAEGEQADKAFENFLLAGENAFRLFALDEALRNFDEAMSWVENSAAANDQLIQLYRRRGRTLELLLRQDEALESYESLGKLGESRDDDSLRLAGIVELAILYSVSRSDRESAQVYAEDALALSRQLGDRRMETRSLWSLVLAHAWSGAEQVLDYGDAGLLIARELAEDPDATTEDQEILAKILNDVTVPLIALGRVDEAIEKANEAKELFERIGNIAMVTTASQRLGLTFKAVGRFSESEKVYRESAEIDLSIGNLGGLVGSSLGLLDIYPQSGEVENFFLALEQLRPLLGSGGQIPEEMAILYSVVPYFYIGAYDKALSFVDEAIAFEKVGVNVFSDPILSILARASFKIGDHQRGEELLNEIEKDHDVDNYLVLMSAQHPQAVAELALVKGDWRRALDIVEGYIERASDKGMWGFLTEKLMLKGRILIEAGQQEAGYEVFREALALAEGQNGRMFLWEICAILAAMEVEKGNLSEAEVLYEQARNAVDYISAHAGPDDLRDVFLAKPLVKTVLSNSIVKK